MNSLTKTSFAAAALMLALGVSSAQAATCEAGETAVVDPTGNSDFQICYNAAQTGVTLFGTPQLRNNVITFQPNGFFAESIDGSPDSANATINLTLIATDPTFFFDSFNVREEGGYRMTGNAMVDLDGLFIARDANNPFNSQQDAIQPDQPLNIIDGNEHFFTASAFLGASNGWAPGTVNEVDITIENLLNAMTTGTGSRAFIEKKFAGVAIEINPIPIPGALFLFAPAIAGLLAVRRRR